MSWSPTDLVSDADLRDYEGEILTNFGVTSWQAKRTKAFEDWLFPVLRARGFDPYKLRTRLEPAKAWSYTASAYGDVTAALQSTTDDDLNAATVFATPGSDALFIGSTSPFRGLFLRLADSVSSATGALSVAYWNGAWQALTLADGTQHTSGKTLSGSGSVLWLLPLDWAVRAVNSSDPLYWAKVTVSAVPTSAKIGQVGAIRASVFRGPATFRTLQLIFQEAPTGQDGPWNAKAAFYKGEADEALERALLIGGGEFDTDATDLISAAEDAQTPEEAGGGPWVLERA